MRSQHVSTWRRQLVTRSADVSPLHEHILMAARELSTSPQHVVTPRHAVSLQHDVLVPP